MPHHLPRVLQIVLGALATVVVAVLVLGLVSPREWSVQRSVMVNAPPAAIHAWVGDLRHWPEWAQWNQAALSPRNSLGERTSGLGARLTWYSERPGHERLNGEVEIIASAPERGVTFEHRVNGSEPSRATLRYAAGPGVTEVSWRDEGRLPFIMGGLMRDRFETQLAEHMAAGLERLKERVESLPAAAAP